MPKIGFYGAKIRILDKLFVIKMCHGLASAN